MINTLIHCEFCIQLPILMSNTLIGTLINYNTIERFFLLFIQ